MKRSSSGLMTLVAVLLAAGPTQAKLRVVATVPDLAAIAQAVGRDRVEITSLSTPNQDPHFVDARPHLMLGLNRADLLLVIGLELEVGWLPVLLTGARNSRIQPGSNGYLDCSTVVELRQVPQMRIDRSMGDIHAGGNPHYLLSDRNALRVAKAVAARLSILDPDGRQSYRANARVFETSLKRAKKRWLKVLGPYRGTKAVVFHNAWVYFAEMVGFQIVGYVEPKPGIAPSPSHLLQLIKRMRAMKVALLLCKTYYPDRATKLVAKKTGATLVRVSGGADLSRHETYFQRMDRVVDVIATALKARKARAGGK